MRTTVHTSSVRVVDLTKLSDEQLAEAQQLISETMTTLQGEGDRKALIKLFEQQCAVNREARERSNRAMVSRGIR